MDMTSRTPLCFAQVRDGFSDEDRVWHMIQHMRGARHRGLCHPTPEPMTKRTDPLGHSIRKVALENGYEVLSEDEAKMYEELILAALKGDLDTIDAKFDEVKALRDPFLNPLQPVTVSGALRGHIVVLKFGLDKGAKMNKDVAMAVKMAVTNSSTSMKDYYEANKADIDKVAQFNPRKGVVKSEDDIIWQAIRETDHLW